MSSGQPSLVHLRRIDPERGMWRFYSLTLQPTLLGGVDLIRRWGRIGTQGGSVLVETYPDEASAQAALERLAALKRRRGYADPPTHPVPPVAPDWADRNESRADHWPVPLLIGCDVPLLMSPVVTGAEPAARP